ncbi:zinc-dependent metalloprotease [Halococcus sediminicola]|uniref:zinc-dependent metalloprotease n=1 Tax=Halococcus sediminicola TaxID=1264579 RepID=UPI00067928D1|nr:zinc-dependent metalloprotease [Halococcus sediminicola]
MTLYDSVRAITAASGDGLIDWTAVTEAAKAAVDAGELSLSPAARDGYARDVRDARARVGEVAGVDFDVPDTIEVQNRHHWIDANVATFERVMGTLEANGPNLAGLARVLNTGSMSVALAFLASNVLGQYDPLLLAESPSETHALYFVQPNIARVADELDVSEERFRRWIAFHEVTHAAEFGAAPWLPDHLEARMERSVEALGDGKLDRQSFRELNAAMTAVEGYAELLMDRAFDDEYEDLREKVEARRRGRGPLFELVGRLLGIGMKRRQYERGKAFFDYVVEARDIETASLVWEVPENLPSDAEIDAPETWLARVD